MGYWRYIRGYGSYCMREPAVSGVKAAIFLLGGVLGGWGTDAGLVGLCLYSLYGYYLFYNIGTAHTYIILQ